MIRLFIAIEPAENIRDQIIEICHGIPGARWTKKEQLHLTLQFIGEVKQELFLDIREVLSALSFKRFELTLSGVQIFMNKNVPSVLHIEAQSTELQNLQTLISQSLLEVGIKPERRKYQPHITLARLNSASPDRIKTFLEQYGNFQTDPFTVSEFHLFSSRLKKTGAIHTIEESYMLDEC